MIKLSVTLIALLFFTSCIAQKQKSQNIITSDIGNFWIAYDKITSTKDSVQQYEYLVKLFLEKGTLGLNAIIENRGYTPKEYLDAINKYPKFWSSVRANTLRTNEFSAGLEKGIEKLKKVYPDLKPAQIYFTIGALRTGGTTTGNMVLIGSEIAMTDTNTVSSEFPSAYRDNRRTFFDSNPIDDLVLLNVHEYVHTQQKPALNNLLSFVIREGIAEFVSCYAMGVPSAVPAIEYGKQNDQVRKTFEEELFYGNNTYQWLWGDAPNDFGVRDLGYYIGYQLSELYFEKATDKKAAIKKLIELDYTNETEIENFVNGTGFFSASLEVLYQQYQIKRPTVVGIAPFGNNDQNVSAKTNQITITFSEPINQDFRNFDYGPLGEEAAIRIKNIIGYSEDGKSLTFEIQDLQPNKQYQLVIGWGFRNLENVPVMEYLIDFKTSDE